MNNITVSTNQKEKKAVQLIKGMKDILPDDQKYWTRVKQLMEDLAWSYRYQRIDTPMVEYTKLFNRSIGNHTDIVEKEMYSFKDKGNEDLSLRPELTAGVMRSYIEHGMINMTQPVKLFYFGPCFRYDRPQSGRQRQFNQVGFEAIGEASSIIDAQVINIGYKFLKNLSLPVVVDINSIGCPTCRQGFITALLDVVKGKKNQLCEDCKKRIVKNPLRILDCQEENCQKIYQDAPQQVDYLCEPCRTHFISTLEYLDDLDVKYNLNPKIVRGLDYYNRTSFEYNIESVEQTSQQLALGGGGRYDGLAEELGGRPTPAIGFALGVERIVRELKERDIKVAEEKNYDVFIAQLGQEARRKALGLMEKMIDADIAVAESMTKDGLKSQLELANKLNVKYTLILGQKEMVDGTVLIRDMEGGIQEVVDFNKTIQEVKKRLRARIDSNQ